MPVTLRPATMADVPLLERWDAEPHVIAAATDEPDATQAFAGAYWPDEIAMQSNVFQYYIGDLDSRPIGAMLIIDPHLEPTHYWGEIEPNLRALDIWIGEPDCLGKGYGSEMMRIALGMCFADPRVTAAIVDPLASNERVHRFYQRLGFKPVERRILPENDDCLVHRVTREDWMATQIRKV
ncbi:MAG: GNAT family N-acetyltransferase [Hyphomicrobiales bacterium]|nr:GNAT family N-acetyltransferase [Hyphomicrobiales bacterium]